MSADLAGTRPKEVKSCQEEMEQDPLVKAPGQDEGLVEEAEKDGWEETSLAPALEDSVAVLPAELLFLTQQELPVIRSRVRIVVPKWFALR